MEATKEYTTTLTPRKQLPGPIPPALGELVCGGTWKARPLKGSAPCRRGLLSLRPSSTAPGSPLPCLARLDGPRCACGRPQPVRYPELTRPSFWLVMSSRSPRPRLSIPRQRPRGALRHPLPVVCAPEGFDPSNFRAGGFPSCSAIRPARRPQRRENCNGKRRCREGGPDGATLRQTVGNPKVFTWFKKRRPVTNSL